MQQDQRNHWTHLVTTLIDTDFWLWDNFGKCSPTNKKNNGEIIHQEAKKVKMFTSQQKTRLTYNCAHLRSTKETLTIEYFRIILEKKIWLKFFWVKFFWLKIFWGENFLGKNLFWVKFFGWKIFWVKIFWVNFFG